MRKKRKLIEFDRYQYFKGKIYNVYRLFDAYIGVRFSRKYPFVSFVKL